MYKSIAALTIALALSALVGFTSLSPDPAQQVLNLEHQAMDGWLDGNPDPFLAMADPQITYFHVMTNARLDGLAAVRALCETYRGKPLFDRYEIVDPKVQAGKDIAVLSYILVTHDGADSSRWNATEVYQQKEANWRVIHSHFSKITQPSDIAPK
jgi:Calcium/calmodulin dependent protein kinase II association domain